MMTVVNDDYPMGRNPKYVHDKKPGAGPMVPAVKGEAEQAVDLLTQLAQNYSISAEQAIHAFQPSTVEELKQGKLLTEPAPDVPRPHRLYAGSVQGYQLSPRDQMRAIFEEGAELFYLKNNEYGNSIELTGLVGAIAAMTGDLGAARKMTFESLRNSTTQMLKIKIRNKLIDAMVQAAIAIKMLDDENHLGR